MKLVFFDLRRDTTRLDSSRYAEPLAFPESRSRTDRGPWVLADNYYNNKIMNYYGDSFHVTKHRAYNYSWTYETAQPNRIVVNAARVNSELKKTYQPWQVKLKDFQTSRAVSACPTRPYKDEAVAEQL